MIFNTKHCLICKDGKKNECLYWHKDPDTNEIWVWCQGKCQRGYSIWSYCHHAGIPLNEFLKGDFDFIEAPPNEVNKMEFPTWFITLSDPRAEMGVKYLKSRGLRIEGDMYYDTYRNGIVFPYYYENIFVGAQIRFIVPKILDDGDEQKMDTLPGTRLGLVFYGWNQSKFMTHVKGIIVTEGAINAISLQQALNDIYGNIAKNPWRVIACSGSGGTKHHLEAIKELKDQGLKVVCAPDSDEAGLHMLKKFSKAEAMTHYSLTGDTEKDWNDILRDSNHETLAKLFLSNMRAVR